MNGDIGIVELVKKKRDKEELSENEINYFIKGVVQGYFTQAQVGATLMAMYLNGLNTEETRILTQAMLTSGEVLHWPKEWKGRLVDKHSTGGVGDKVSLPLVPALAACGLKVPMISGRGLSHTGGTLDKLESIPGFNISCSASQMMQQMEEVGCCIVGQTHALVPADKILYSTRDSTGTVESIPLIVGSIMSKKGAEGLDALVLEVTYGRAANVREERDARILAKAMIETGQRLGIRTSALMTKMDHPIGQTIGHTLEIMETVQCLQGLGTPDLQEVVTKLGGQLLFDTDHVISPAEGAQMIARSLRDGSAKAKFLEMLIAQGVAKTDAHGLFDEQDISQILPQAKMVTDLCAQGNGYLQEIDALTCGRLVHRLGGGRQKPSDVLNYAVGLQIMLPRGAYVTEGDVWAKIHHDTELTSEIISQLKAALCLSPHPPTVEAMTVITDTLT